MPIPRNLTLKTQSALENAYNIATSSIHQELSPIHLLASLLQQTDTIIDPLFKRLGVDKKSLVEKTDAEISKLPKVDNLSADQVFASREMVKVLEKAADEAKKMEDEYVSVEHLLVSLIEVDSAAQKILINAGLDYTRLKEGLKILRGSQKVTDENPEDKFQALEKYGVDLTKKASDGKLDPVIGRDEEIRRVMQVLSRRTKNNPVLIGEPGVGKTAIVEGLAQRIVAVDLRLEDLKRRLKQKDIEVEVSDKVKKYLIKEGYDPVYGARPLKRTIQNILTDELALQIIEGKIKEGQKVAIDLEGSQVVLKILIKEIR